MRELKYIIAQNLIDQRKESGLTQSEVAEKLNYSDKSISKWEHAKAIPTLEILMELAKVYNSTLDELVTDKEIRIKQAEQKNERAVRRKYSHLAITLLSISLIWVIATVVFAVLRMVEIDGWLAIVWAFPTSCIVGTIFNSIWGVRRYNYWILSASLWLTIGALFFTLQHISPMFELFIIGVPFQIVIVLTKFLIKK